MSSQLADHSTHVTALTDHPSLINCNVSDTGSHLFRPVCVISFDPWLFRESPAEESRRNFEKTPQVNCRPAFSAEWATKKRHSAVSRQSTCPENRRLCALRTIGCIRTACIAANPECSRILNGANSDVPNKGTAELMRIWTLFTMPSFPIIEENWLL